jgi:hypothetical protein
MLDGFFIYIWLHNFKVGSVAIMKIKFKAVLFEFLHKYLICQSNCITPDSSVCILIIITLLCMNIDVSVAIQMCMELIFSRCKIIFFLH